MPRSLRRQRQVRRVKSIRPPRQPIEREEYQLEPLTTEKTFLPGFEKQYEAELEARAMPRSQMPNATILERVVYKALWDRGYRPPDLDFQSSMQGGRLEWGFGRQVADFAIRSLGIIIECQGGYWHQFGEQRQRDIEREVLLRMVPRPVPWLVYFLQEPVIRDRYALELWLDDHVVHAGLRREDRALPGPPAPWYGREELMVTGNLPETGQDWSTRSPINYLVNGGFEADSVYPIGWTVQAGATATIVGGKLRINASSADNGVYQELTGLRPDAIYTVVCQVNTGGNEARIITTGSEHNLDEIVKTVQERQWSGLCRASSTGTLTLYLTAHTTGVNVDFDDVCVFRGHLAFPFVPNSMDSWRHPSDSVLIDGGDIYAHSVTAEKVNVVPGNMLANGGFEAGTLVEWTAGDGSPAVQSGNAHSGSYGAQGTGDGVNNLAVLTQSIKVQPSRNYHLSVWVKNGTGTGQAGCYVVWLDKNGGSVGLSSAHDAASTTWAKKSIVAAAPASAATAEFTLTISSDNSATVYFDDCEFYDTDAELLVGIPGGARVQITGSGIQGYKAGPVQTLNVGTDGKFWFGAASGNESIVFDGSTTTLTNVSLSITDGTFTLKNATSGARVELDTNGLRTYDAAAQRVNIGKDGKFWFGAASGANSLVFNGSTMALTDVDLSIVDGGFTLKSGTSGARVELDSNGLRTYDAAAAQKVNLAKDGTFLLKGNDTNYLQWDGTNFTVKGQIYVTGGDAAKTDLSNVGANVVSGKVNADSTLIQPGRILISGSTTLDDWRHPSDTTLIDGGDIYAGSITAEKGTFTTFNLVDNPGFEFPSVGWALQPGASFQTDNPRSGSRELRYNPPSNGEANVAFGSLIPVRAGQTYYAEVYCHATGGAVRTMGVRLAAFDKDKVYLRRYVGTLVTQAGGGYTKRSALITVDSDVSFLRVELYVGNDCVTGTQHYWDDVVLREATGMNVLVGVPGGARVEINSSGIQGYKAGPVQTLNVGTDGKFWFGAASGNESIVFDGSTMSLTNVSLSVTDGTFALKSGTSGARVELDTNGLRTYDAAAAQKVNLAKDGTFLLKGNDTNYLQWDGTNFTVKGQIYVTGGDAAKTDLTNVTANTVVGKVNTAGATLIAPGRIEIYGGTTLEGWRYGDTTYIDGGDIYANTITASQMAVVNANLVTNHSFEYGTAGWTLKEGASIVTYGNRTGTYGARGDGNRAAGYEYFVSDFIPIQSYMTYYAECYCYCTTGSRDSGGMLFWYNKDKTYISSNGFHGVTGTSWSRWSVLATAPSTAAFARVMLSQWGDPVASSLSWDDVTLRPASGMNLLVGTPNSARVEINNSGIEGYSDSTTKQFYLRTSDGRAMFGGGKGVLDSSGLVLDGNETSYKTYNAVRWLTQTDPPGGNEIARVAGGLWRESNPALDVIANPSQAYTTGSVWLESRGKDSETHDAYCNLYAATGSARATICARSSAGTAMIQVTEAVDFYTSSGSTTNYRGGISKAGLWNLGSTLYISGPDNTAYFANSTSYPIRMPYAKVFFPCAGDAIFSTTSTSFTQVGRTINGGINALVHGIPGYPTGHVRRFYLVVSYSDNASTSGYEGAVRIRNLYDSSDIMTMQTLPRRWANSSYWSTAMFGPFTWTNTNNWAVEAKLKLSGGTLWIYGITFLIELDTA